MACRSMSPLQSRRIIRALCLAAFPARISGHGVTSLHDLGLEVSMDEVDEALKGEFV